MDRLPEDELARASIGDRSIAISWATRCSLARDMVALGVSHRRRAARVRQNTKKLSEYYAAPGAAASPSNAAMRSIETT
jgi:hypothetical protein